LALVEQRGAPKRKVQASLKSGGEGLPDCPKELRLKRKLVMEINSTNTSGQILA
jgi:hypothetical protein